MAKEAVNIHRCAIVGEQGLMKLMLRYLGEGPDLNNDETQILLMALYMESCAAGGLARRGVDHMDRRLEEQAAVLAKLQANYGCDPEKVLEAMRKRDLAGWPAPRIHITYRRRLSDDPS